METLWWRLKAYGGWVGVGIAGLLAYLHGFGLISHFIESQDHLHVAANIYLATLFFGVILLAAYRQWVSIRKERYANITPVLHQIFHQIRDLNAYIKTKEPVGGNADQYQQFSDNCKIMFGGVLDGVSTVFRSITSTHCRASIKLTYTKNNKLYVYTLTRDQGSRQRCLRLDNERVKKDHDPLDKNIQFARLFSDSEDIWHYVCNDLTKDNDFRATSLTAYSPDHATKAPRRWRIFSRDGWPLPYKSTITCVIRQPPFDMNQSLPSEVLGFLAVDSESRQVFEERWDVQLMLAVADALYIPTSAFLDAQNRVRPRT
jgi:hypothetical protein